MNNHAKNNQVAFSIKTFSDAYFEWLRTNESSFRRPKHPPRRRRPLCGTSDSGREEGIMEASAALAPGHLHPSEESQSDGSSSEMDPKMDVLQLATPSKSLDIEEVVKASSLLNTPVKRGTESLSHCEFFKMHSPIWASMPDAPSWELEEPEPNLFELDDEDKPGNVVQNRSLDSSEAESPIETLSPSKKVVAPRNMVFSPRTKAPVPTPPSQPPSEVEEEEFMMVDEVVVSPFSFRRTKRRPKELETSSSSEHGGSPDSKDFSTEEEGDARQKKPVKTGSSQISSNTPVKKTGSAESSRNTPVKKTGSAESSRNTPVKKTGSAQSSRNTPVKKTGSAQSSRNTPVKKTSSAQSSSKAGSKKYPKKKVSSDSSALETEVQPTKDSSEEEKTDSSDSVVCSSKRRRRPPGDWWLSHGLGIGDSPTSDRRKRSPSKTPRATKRPSQTAGTVEVEATRKRKPTVPTGDASENGNVAISPQREAPELPLRKTFASTPKAVGRVHVLVSSSPCTGSATEEDGISFPVEEEQASPPSDSSLSEEQSAMEDADPATRDSVYHSTMEGEASGKPAVEVSASYANQRPAVIGASSALTVSPVIAASSSLTESPVRRWPSQDYSFPSRNRLSDDKSQGFVSGPPSLIELDSREEEDAFLPSSTVQSRCPVSSLSATGMCALPLAPVSLTYRDQEDLSVWWNIVWPSTAYDSFQWFSHRGRILGVCTDLVHDSCCAGKVLLGYNMRKPLWVDHSATTVFHVLMGCVALTMDGETSRYSPGQSFIVPCGHAHSLKNPGEQPVILGFTRMLAESASDDDQ